MRISDWSSDVCSSDLGGLRRAWVAWAVHYLWEAWAAHCLWEGCRDSTSRCKILVLLPMNVLGERSSGCSGPSARGPRVTLCVVGRIVGRVVGADLRESGRKVRRPSRYGHWAVEIG